MPIVAHTNGSIQTSRQPEALPAAAPALSLLMADDFPLSCDRIIHGLALKYSRYGRMAYADAYQSSMVFLLELKKTDPDVPPALAEATWLRILVDRYLYARVAEELQQAGLTRDGLARARLLYNPLTPFRRRMEVAVEQRVTCQRFYHDIYPVLPFVYQNLLTFCITESESDHFWQAEYAEQYDLPVRTVSHTIYRLRKHVRDLLSQRQVQKRQGIPISLSFDARHRHRSLSPNDEVAVRRLRSTMSCRALARRFGVSPSLIHRVCKR